MLSGLYTRLCHAFLVLRLVKIYANQAEYLKALTSSFIIFFLDKFLKI